ncbi:MAG TPA: branched-chain amino acid ABC transporter substrate-binding protein [Candidatus Eremiobacteraceae bacterium]|nr:branched-chain amino acid ABC transporter substrate-binding protein [Candidatus Eremiobacteraceae bacterium]
MFAAALVACCCAAPAASLADFEPYTKVITISLVAPLSGDERQLGIDLSNGVNLAVDETNESRSLTDFGWKVQTFDDQADPGIALQEAQFALVDPTVGFVIGHVGAEETNFALQTYHEQEMPLIIPTQPYFQLTQHGYDNVFRLCPTDVEEGTQAAKYAEKTLKAKLVTVVYVKDQFGVDSALGFQNYAASGKTTKTDGIGVDVDMKSDKDIVAAVKADAPDVLYFSGPGAKLQKVLADIRAAGITAPAIANDGFYDPASLKAAGSASDGMLVTSCVPPLDLMPTAQVFVHHYQARYGQPSSFALFGYVAAQIAIAAAKQIHTADHLQIDRELSVGTFETIIGQISFQRGGDVFEPDVYFYKASSGQLKYDSASVPNPLIISRQNSGG